MNPTLLYNNYHLQRRKMYENNPRNNLYSTIDFTWRQSVEHQLSPKEKMESKKEIQRKLIGERSNELIAKRLKREVLLDGEVWRSANMEEIQGKLGNINRKAMNTIDIGSNINTQRRSASLYDKQDRNSLKPLTNLHQMKDTLNDEVQNYYSSNKLTHQPTNHKNQQPTYPNYKPQSLQPHNRYDNYTRHFDPQLQSLVSRQSMASSELSELIPKKKGYLARFLNKKLETYLVDGKSSRDASFYDLDGIKNDDQTK